MLFKIKNFCYHQQKEIIEQRHKKSFLFKHLIEVFSMTIFAIRLSICLLFFKCKCNYKPFQEFMSKYTGNLFQFYVLLVLMLNLLTIEGKYYFNFTDINHIIFKISYSINVINIEQINSCLLLDHEKNNRFQVFVKIFEKKFYQKHQWLQYILPKYFKKLFRLFIRFQFISHLNHVDQDRLKRLQLPFIQQSTLNIRAKFYSYYLILEKISICFHLLILSLIHI